MDTLDLHLASQVEKRKEEKEEKRSPFYQLEVTQTERKKLLKSFGIF